MTAAVLYTRALEPITVIDVPMRLWDLLSSGQRVKLAVREALATPLSGETLSNYRDIKYRTVILYAEKFRYRDAESLMLFTEDEEHALLLQADFLPGQRTEVRRRQANHRARGFAEGFLAAIDRMG